jgi:DNA-directed RNA polymerase specialized sigma subunit
LSDPVANITNWQQDPTPGNAKIMLDSLQPFIVASTKSYLRTDSPLAVGKAKSVVLQAMKTYDPTRSQPQTFISQHVQGLQRWQAAKNNGLRVPSRVSSQSLLLDKAEEDLLDELGRAPSTAELAKRTNLTASAIERIRSFSRPTVGSQESQGSDDEDLSVAEDQILRPQDDKAWLELVYDDLPDNDKVVMEHTIGMFGKSKLSTSELAKKLGVSSGAISQRRARVQAYIDRALEVNPL